MTPSKAPRNGVGAVAARQGVLGQNALDAPLDQLLKTANTHQNSGTAQLAGRLMEDLHAASGSASAARHGFSDLTFRTGDALGLPTHPADVFVLDGSDTVNLAQLKCCGTNADTTGDIAKIKYDGMQRVVPEDQVKRVREIATKRGMDGLGKRNYPETAETVSDRVRHGRVESRPVPREQARNTAADPEAAVQAARRAEGLRTIRNTAVSTAVVAGGVSVFRNVRAVHAGEKELGEAALSVGLDTAAGLASGAATGAATVAVRSALGKAGARGLARGSGPVAAGLFLAEVGKDGFAMLSGEIDGNELGRRAAGHAVKGATTWAGMEAGAAIGSFFLPGLGTIVGGLLGAIGGGLFGESLTSAAAVVEPAEPEASRNRVVGLSGLTTSRRMAIEQATHLHRYTVSGGTVITWVQADDLTVVIGVTPYAEMVGEE